MTDTVQQKIEETGRKVWFPPTSKIVGVNKARKSCVAIIGPSGSGKSHTGRQLLLHPDYGMDEVLFITSEDASTTYGTNFHERSARTFGEATAILEELIDAAHGEEKLPKVVFIDSFSGLTDYELQYFIDNPKMSKQNNRDKIAEFGLLGEAGTKFMLTLRNELPTDSVVLVTSHEGAFAPQPELALQGKVLPKNFMRWTDVCLHLHAESAVVDPGRLREKDQIVYYQDDSGKWEAVSGAHVEFGRDHNGEFDGNFIQRFFYTRGDGKVQAKGHHNLFMKEPANLPMVLKKIHGEVLA